MKIEDRVLKELKQLPTLPAVVAELSRLVMDPDVVVAQIERVITPDPAITASMLRLANSPFFGLTREVTSVRQAIVLLGSQRVYELAAVAAFAGVLPNHLPGYDITANGYWRHCVAVAVIAERLSKELHIDAPDLIFTAGLLHDIGKLVVGTLLEEQKETLTRTLSTAGCLLVEAESRTLGLDHGHVGALVADHWQLPEVIGHVARWHHTPSLAKESSARAAVDLVHLADGLAHVLGHGADVGGLARDVSSEVAVRLGISVWQLELVACSTLDAITEMAARVGIR